MYNVNTLKVNYIDPVLYSALRDDVSREVAVRFPLASTLARVLQMSPVARVSSRSNLPPDGDR